jgi:hypothetical protein
MRLPHGLRALALVQFLGVLGLATGPVSAAFQTPKQDPAKTGGNDILDAEREKLRMKDVEAWKKIQVKSLDQVTDVKTSTKPVEYPASITEEQKTKMNELLQRAKDGGGGARTGRALRDLEKMGFPALVFLVNQLREINYKDPTDAMFGMQLNNTLTSITMGVNTGYVAVDIGEEMDPRKAQWNAQTVAQWIGGVEKQWPTQEKFDEFIAKRKLKKEKELEGEENGTGGEKGKEPEKKEGEKKGG